jgi:predicted permease
MQTLSQDIRYSLRLLIKNPAFTSVAVFALVLGIVATTVIFTLVDAALLRPLPYSDPSRLVAVFDSRTQIVASRFESSYPDFLDWREQNTTLSSLAGYVPSGSVARFSGVPELVSAGAVTANFFKALGVQPIIGRDFRDDEDAPSADRVVMLTYSAFQKHFGGRPEAIGQHVTIDNVPATIIGVLPKNFVFAPIGSAELWRPMHPDGDMLKRRNLHWVNVIGRLKPGVSLASATADMLVVSKRLEQTFPQSNNNLRTVILPLTEIIVGDIRPILRILFAAVELLLLIACVNVANLLLNRSLSRQREIAVRTALGASRLRLVRQVLTEGILLALIAGAWGIMIALVALRTLPQLVGQQTLARMPFLQDLALSTHMVLFVAASSLLAGILFSLIPALQTSKPQLQQVLRQGSQMTASRAWRRVTSSFVVSEMAMALVLLVGAALLVKTLHRLLTVDVGFNPEHLITMTISLPQRYNTDESVINFQRSLIERMRALPGVAKVGSTSTLPIVGGNTVNSRVVGDPVIDQGHESNIRDVSPDYFSTLQAKLIKGRWFTDADDASAPKRVIVNQKYVDLFMNGRDPLTHPIVFTFSPTQKPREIVGVVDNIREGPLDSELHPAIYEPFAQSPDSNIPLVIGASGASDAVFTSAQKAIHELEGDAVVYRVRTMRDVIDSSPSALLHRYAAWLTTAFALAALLLGVVGLYGVINHSVAQRTQEIGVRIAVGAQRADVLRLVLAEGGVLIALGAILGLAASLFTGQLLHGLLFAVKEWDPLAFAVSVLVLAGIATVASCIPAWRATKVSPIQALRYE